MPKRSGIITTLGVQSRNINGLPRFGVSGRAIGCPRSCSATSNDRMSISWPIGQNPDTTVPAGGGTSRSTCSASAAPHAGSHAARAASICWRSVRLALIRSAEKCGAAMAVGVSSSQSLLVQVGTRYRDQDPDRASSRGSA